MPRSDFREPPLVENTEDFNAYMRDLFNRVFGFGDDVTGDLDELNIADPLALSGTKRDSFTIDSDDTSTDEIILQFGTTRAETLTHTSVDSRFELSDPLLINSDILIDNGSITSTSGAISFGDENLSTTGTLGCGALTATGITVSGLATNSVVHTNGSSALITDSNFTYNGTTLTLSDAFTQTGVGTINGTWTWTGGGVTLNNGTVFDVQHNATITFQNTANAAVIATIDNDGSDDLSLALANNIDFRIDTDGASDLFIIDGTNDIVGILAVDTNSLFNVEYTGSSFTNVMNVEYTVDTIGTTKSGLNVLAVSAQDPAANFPAIIGAKYIVNAQNATMVGGTIQGMTANASYKGEGTLAGLTGLSATTSVLTTEAGSTWVIEKMVGANITFVEGGGNNKTVSVEKYYGLLFEQGTTGAGQIGSATDDWYQIFIEDFANFDVTIDIKAGIWMNRIGGSKAATNNYGIVLDGDGAGSDIVFGVDQENRIYTTTDASENLILDTTGGAGKVSINNAYDFPNADGTSDEVMVTDGADTLTWKTGTVDIPICIGMYDAEPSRGSETNFSGGLLLLDAAATVGPATPANDFTVTTKGSGKIMIVINAGTDTSGDITITGTSVDRDSMTQTALDTSVITISGTTTDSSSTDANGNTVHGFTNAYISDKWFTGVVTLSSSTVNISDMDIYHVSFEQVNDQTNLTLDTFDANIYTTNVNAEFDAYLYTLHVTGDTCVIEEHGGGLHVGSVGGAKAQAAVANKYYRLRTGNINDAVNGSTDGFWVDVHYSNSPAYVEDVSLKVWFTKQQSITWT